MEEWVQKALQRWPNVPALFGWLTLDRRGRWLIQNELITRPQIIDVINRNYAADAQGRWYFQNGPQRGYMTLEYAPLVLHTVDGGAALQTHNQLAVTEVRVAYMDEHGAIVLSTEHGPALLADDNLDWALERLRVRDRSMTEEQLRHALSLPSGSRTDLALQLTQRSAGKLTTMDVSIVRLDFAAAPARLHFVRNPTAD